jgi:hypothetical protein
MASMAVGISMVMHMTTTTGINWNLTPILDPHSFDPYAS